MVLDFGWLQFCWVLFFVLLLFLISLFIYCSVSWWSLFLRSQLLLSAPMASDSPVWDEEPSLTNFARWNCVLSAHHGEILLISEVLSGWETTCDTADVVFIIFRYLLIEGELERSGFKDCFVLEYLMMKRKWLVPFLVKLWQRGFFLLLRSQLVIKMRCHFNEDENMQHLNAMWNYFPVGQAYGVLLMSHVKYEACPLSFSAFLAALKELGNVEQLA